MLRATACIASLVGALAFAGPAVAAPGGNGPSTGSSSIGLLMASDPGEAASTTTAATSTPSYGDWVTFDVATDETEYPWVNLQCYQGKTLVANGWEGFFDRAFDDGVFGLYSGVWTGGGAECTADLVMSAKRGWRTLASTSFHVDG